MSKRVSGRKLGLVRRAGSAVFVIATLAPALDARQVGAPAGDHGATAAATAGQTTGSVTPDAHEDFQRFLAGVRADALSRGIGGATLDRALTGLTPNLIVIERDQTQAELVLSVDQYVTRRVSPATVRTAKRMVSRHEPLLRRVAAQYGVPGHVIVAVWGLESNFGRFTGVRPTVQALATLAWEGRRGPFFRGELLSALEILDRGLIELDRLRGSWAGAMGQPQFMPSSYLQYAEDFDGDGRRDIWTSHADIFASIANYLRVHRWNRATTWGREVRVPGNDVDRLRREVGMRGDGCRARREMTRRLPLGRWQALGVRTTSGGSLPAVALDASLIWSGTRAFLVYDNYEAVLDYNCAHAYALAVVHLADRAR
ncbi:MAG: lytic murein transglycosylase [Acidobacteriota bacterium]